VYSNLIEEKNLKKKKEQNNRNSNDIHDNTFDVLIRRVQRSSEVDLSVRVERFDRHDVTFRPGQVVGRLWHTIRYNRFIIVFVFFRLNVSTFREYATRQFRRLSSSRTTRYPRVLPLSSTESHKIVKRFRYAFFLNFFYWPWTGWPRRARAVYSLSASRPTTVRPVSTARRTRISRRRGFDGLRTPCCTRTLCTGRPEN